MKYKSEIYEVLHQDAIADFKVGAISETELREFEEICFVREGEPAYEAENIAEPLVREPSVQMVTAH
jgi:DNA-binding transcriptional regulator YiaG